MQAKDLVEQLVVNMHVFYECDYKEDIHAVFVETGGRCPSFRIIFSIKRDINSFSRCANASQMNERLHSWLSNNSYGTVELFRNFRGDPHLNPAYCGKDIEIAPNDSNERCHRVIYCKQEQKDRTVCLVGNYFKKNDTAENEQNFEVHYKGLDPRKLCLVIFPRS
jgi:hypothetical protein